MTLRQCLKQAIAQYDAAPSIADRKEAAVVVVERVRMYLASVVPSFAPRRIRRISGKCEEEKGDVPLHDDADNKAFALRLGITCKCDFVSMESPTRSKRKRSRRRTTASTWRASHSPGSRVGGKPRELRCGPVG